MFIIKKVISILLGTIIILGSITTALNIPVIFSNWTLTVAQTSGMSPQILEGSLIVSQPVPVNNLKEGDLTVFGVSTGSPRIGKTIDVEERNGMYSVRAYGSGNEADIITYNTNNSINQVSFSIPVLGYILTPLTSPVGAIIFAGFFALIGVLYLSFFFARKPKLVREKEPEVEVENQLKVLQEIFDAAPERKPTRKERKHNVETIRNKELVNV